MKFAVIGKNKKVVNAYIKVLKKDLKYWKDFFNKSNIPNYVNQGSTIGEYVILIPVEKLKSVDVKV